jgi:hypothetical protein
MATRVPEIVATQHSREASGIRVASNAREPRGQRVRNGLSLGPQEQPAADDHLARLC